MELRYRFSEPQKINQTSQSYKQHRFSEPLSFQRKLDFVIYCTLIRQGSENRHRFTLPITINTILKPFHHKRTNSINRILQTVSVL
jgi:hypothetical protein